MADKKISALTSASTPLAGTEVLPIVQSGSTVKVSVADLTAGRAISATGATLSGLTASKPVFTDGSSALTSSGTVPTNQGGTGLTSFTANGVPYATSTSALITGTGLQFDGASFSINGAPQAWSSSWKAYDFGTAKRAVAQTGSGAGEIAMVLNAFFSAANSRWDFSYAGDYAVRYGASGDGKHKMYSSTAAGASAGDAITWTTVQETDKDGNFTIAGATATKSTGTTWANPSDSRLKDNVQPYKKGLDELMQLQPCTWTFNGKGGSTAGAKGLGLIADQVQVVLPDTVTEYLAKLNPADAEDTAIKKFDASEVIWLLVNSVKQLNEKIDQLESAK